MKYPKTVIDECSGVEVPNELYKAYLDGINDVVEWAEEESLTTSGLLVHIHQDRWQAQKKMWGIKEG